MDELIADQIEWLLANNSNTNRLGRQLVMLVGFLADGSLPDEIERHTASLSRLIVHQDIFEALVGALNMLSRQAPLARSDKAAADSVQSAEPARLLDQIEAARRDIAACDPVNYAQLIAWIVAQAKARKILKARGRR
ncbi:MAG TPA: hypothetical protein VEN78_22330 [Bradyrhizobium sp.]|nr:hypothetical protein [Bradyrhizobium sp.]